MFIEIYTLKEFVDSIKNSNKTKKSVLKDLGLPVDISDSNEEITNFFLTLREDLTVIVETDYVDKVYRDSYYNYFSTKLKDYQRNCIRVSLFEPNVISDFDLTKDQKKMMQSCYLGFVILRPLVKARIGRNVISPKAKKNGNDLAICEAPIKATCLGYKLSVKGFPHSSQDGEMMTCAETAVWEIMEYFGNKYAMYSPILPSNITSALEQALSHRMLPSVGLSYNEMSQALKKFGMASVIYDQQNQKARQIFTCYIESGFPLAVSLETTETDVSDDEGHAVVCIGRKNVPRSIVNDFNPIKMDNNKSYYLWNECLNSFIFNDDNYPCYQVTNYDNPTGYYNDDFKGAKITNFIVPLHPRIYMDAENAIWVSNVIITGIIDPPENSVIRTFLTSNRSYKEYIVRNEDFSEEEKGALLTLDMAKFVWVTEIADKESFLDYKANGIILIDATGYIIDDNYLPSVLFVQVGQDGYIYDEEDRNLIKYSFGLSTEFKSFRNNLKRLDNEENTNF